MSGKLIYFRKAGLSVFVIGQIVLMGVIVRSYFRCDGLVIAIPTQVGEYLECDTVTMYSNCGKGYVWLVVPDFKKTDTQWISKPADRSNDYTRRLKHSIGVAAFLHESRSYFSGPGDEVYAAMVSEWMVLALAGVLDLLVVIKLRAARKRQGLQLCTKCGYDLRATPLRCPECGSYRK